MGIKSFLRKVIPLRTSTYEKRQKRTEKQLAEISAEVRQMRQMLAQLQTQTMANIGSQQKQLQKHREIIDRANRELLQLWKALPLTPLEPSPDEHPRIIASYTSFPARLEAAYSVAIMLLHQTRRPDRIMLWLASEEFPGQEADLPKHLLELREYGLEIRWCDQNIKGHKKYYYTMLENPDDIVITFDDDLLYEADNIERLLEQYEKTPEAIIASRAHKIKFAEDGELLPYKQWDLCTKDTYVASMDIMSTNGAGTLFPPNSLHKEVFNIENIKALALNTDDLWLKIMSILEGTPTISIQKCEFLCIEGSQEEVLWQANVHGGNNDRSLGAILAVYNSMNESTVLETMRLSSQV